MSSPTALDALKYVTFAGIDILDYITEELALNHDVEDDSHVLTMIANVLSSMHTALQSQVPYRLAPPLTESGAEAPHSNTYERARFYSDGSPVYHDEHCTVPVKDENDVTHLVASTRRVFHPMPGGESA